MDILKSKITDSSSVLNLTPYIKNKIPIIDNSDMQVNCPELCETLPNGEIKIKYGQLVFVLLEEMKKINERIITLEKGEIV